MTRTELEGIFAWCRYFDWWYGDSDDHRVYLQGEISHKNLLRSIGEDPVAKIIYADWKKYYSALKNHLSCKEPKLEDYV